MSEQARNEAPSWGKSRCPNILLIVTDQLRKTALGCYGNSDVHTPVLDQLCSEGLCFENSVSASPVCAPYRATLQSGWYPHQHGVKGNGDLFQPTFKGLADYFNEAGYETCFIGKSHFGLDEIEEKDGWVRPEYRMGWKHWHGTGGDHHWDTPVYDENGELDQRYFGQYGASVRTELAISQIQRKSETPWLIQLNYSEPHVATMPNLYELPATREKIRVLNEKLGFGMTEEMLNTPNPLSFYDSFPQHLLTQLLPEKYLDIYETEKLSLSPNMSTKFERLTQYFLKEYYAMITCVDEEVGRVMQALRDSGQMEDTIVIFTSDHGDMLSNGYLRFKGVPYQNAYRTPFFVWGPGQGVRAGRTDELINSVDVLPTLLGLAHIPATTYLPGVSVAPTVFENHQRIQKEVLLGLAKWRGIFDGQYFYGVERTEGGITPVKLIDTIHDPYDLENLLDASTHHVIQLHLHQSLLCMLKEVDDTDFI